MKTITALLPLLFLGLTGCSTCNQTEDAQLVATISPTAACLANSLEAYEGTENPDAIATSCSASLVDVVQVISDLTSANATPVLAVPEAVPMPPAVQAHLLRIKNTAQNLLNQEAGSAQ